jgi:hypothetical protein
LRRPRQPDLSCRQKAVEHLSRALAEPRVLLAVEHPDPVDEYAVNVNWVPQCAGAAGGKIRKPARRRDADRRGIGLLADLADRGDAITLDRNIGAARIMAEPIDNGGTADHQIMHGTEPPQVMLTEFCVCGTDLAETEAEARRYQGKFVESNFYHYEFLGEHFKTVKGYDAYQ